MFTPDVFFIYLLAAPRGVWDLRLPDQGSIPGHLQWPLSVLTTGPPGQSSPQLRDGTRPWAVAGPRGHGQKDAGPAGLRPADPDGSFRPRPGRRTPRSVAEAP